MNLLNRVKSRSVLLEANSSSESEDSVCNEYVAESVTDRYLSVKSNKVRVITPIISKSVIFFSPDHPELQALETPPPRRRILCVDDSAYNLFVLQELLKSSEEDLEIDTALNGQIAIDLVVDLAKK